MSFCYCFCHCFLGAEHRTFFQLLCAWDILPFPSLCARQLLPAILPIPGSSPRSCPHVLNFYPNTYFSYSLPRSVYLTWFCLCSFSTFFQLQVCSLISFPTATLVAVPKHLSRGSKSRSELDTAILLTFYAQWCWGSSLTVQRQLDSEEEAGC